MVKTISFSGEGKRGPMWLLIKLLEKKQTVRRPRKFPFFEGNLVTLYWKQRTPAKEKPVHKIADAVITRLYPIHYRNFAFDDDFARADGFVNSQELREFFGDVEELGGHCFEVIEFKIKRLYV